MYWFIKALKNCFNFRDRSQRKEYWMFYLFATLINLALTAVDYFTGMWKFGLGLTSSLFALLILIPSSSVSVRRLHDTGHSGWWLLAPALPWVPGMLAAVFISMETWLGKVALVVLVCSIIAVLILSLMLLYWFMKNSQPGDNKYGPNPKAVGALVST